MISINRKAVRASGGTQSDELKAKIKSVTSSTTVGAVFVYDTSQQDSDGGAWRKKTQGLSWYDEAASATRSSRKEFPSMALIVADNNTSGRSISLYDLDDPAMPLWCKFEASGGLASDSKLLSGSTNCNAVFALNGRIYTAHDNTQGRGGLRVINFINDECVLHNTNATYGRFNGNISERNLTLAYRADTSINHIANEQANDVVATVLEGAEIGALGLPIPTVAVATDGGVSVVHPSGDVYDIAGTGQTHDDIKNVFFTDDGMVGYSFEASSSITHPWSIGLRKIPFADEAIGGFSNTTNLERYNPKVNSNVSGLTTQANDYASSNAVLNAVTPTSKNGLAIGYADRLSIVKRNPANMEEGAVAYVTSDYNTGYMLGDIKGAWLTGGDASAEGRYDRSVGNTDLVENGTVLHAAAETDAEVTKYYDFSTSNYFSQAHNANFDFGTGDFSICFWVKKSTISGSQNWISRGDSSEESGDWLIQMQTDGSIDFYRHSGSSWSNQISTSTGAVVVNSWTQVVLLRRGTRYEFWVNGKLEGSASNSNSYTPSGGSALTIGHSLGQTTNPADNSSLSLVRISATSPTPQQVKEIYEAEKPLFKAGAKCLLQSNGYNDVQDMSFDKTTNLLTVGQTSGSVNGATIFKGLEAIDTFSGYTTSGWSAGSTNKIATSGGVSSYGRTTGTGGIVVDLPAIDVRAELNGSDSKLPDDGKFHFSGFTTDATPKVIGQIPICENEHYSIKASVTSRRYNVSESTAYNVTEIYESFYRAFGGNVISRGQISKLGDEGTSTLDFDLNANTSNNTIELKVTGYSGVGSMQWGATVEVERITEKTYER